MESVFREALEGVRAAIIEEIGCSQFEINRCSLHIRSFQEVTSISHYVVLDGAGFYSDFAYHFYLDENIPDFICRYMEKFRSLFCKEAQ